jgi:CRP-like cAMP-binding protein
MGRQRKSKQVDISSVLLQLPLFQEVSESQIAKIVSLTHQQELTRGACLFQKGDLASGFYVIVAGRIKLALPGIKGNERVVDIIGSRQSFGEALMFLNRPYPVFAQALNDSTLLHVAQAPIFELLETDASFARRMLAGMSIRLHHLILDIDTFSNHTGTQRLVSFILQHIHESSLTSSDAPIAFTLPATKQLIASRLCLAPETLSRSLHELSAGNLIEVSGNLISIKNIEGLRAYGPRE